jgi:uncharacterized protein YndB with AHSA1/START domain
MNTQTTDERHVSVIYIKASLDAVWQGLTSPEFTRQYFHATEIESSWEEGSSVTYFNQDRTVAVAGTVLEVSKPDILRISWHVHYNPEAKREAPSQVTYLLETAEDATKLTVIHDGFPENSVVYPEIQKGWIAILSNLKTLLETDSVMSTS